MSLSKDDLTAIKMIVTEIVTEIVEKAIDKAVDDIKQQTAAGFAEVHAKIDELQRTTRRIEIVQAAEIKRNDEHQRQIGNIRAALHAA